MISTLSQTATDLAMAAWAITLELAPWLLLGSLVAGVLHVALPTDFIRRQLRGAGGVVKAVALGVPLPLCSCGVIPAGLGLRKDGASDGAAVGFLISTPQTGVDSVLVSASFLGWPFALFKVAVASITGILGGFSADAVADRHDTLEQPTDAEPEPQERTAAAGADHALDLLRMIWRWVVFGVAVSAVIEVWVPREAFAALEGWGSLTTGLIALAVSLPLYVCATASVPIAAALVSTGMPAGAAIVFLLAGPATNVATIGAVYKALGRRQLVVYLTAIIAGSLVGGALYDLWIGGVESTQSAHEHSPAWWATASAIALCCLFAWFAQQELRSAFDRLRVRSRPAVELAVGGMGCRSCATKVENALRSVDGVDAVEIVLDPGKAIVTGHANHAALIAAVQGAGYSSE